MKKRVLFFGNSHLAALKQGMDQFSPLLNYEPYFFGLIGTAVEQLTNQNSYLSSPSDAVRRKLRNLWGQDSFDCRECEAVCLVGMKANIRTLYPLVTRFQPAGITNSDNRHVISADTYRASSAGLFEQALVGQAARMIRRASKNVPIYVIHQPAPAHWVIEGEALTPHHLAMSWLQALSRSEEAPFLFEQISDALIAATGADGCIAQPQETLQTALTTKNEYMSGPDRFGNGHKTDRVDFGHANARYGVLVLEAVNKMFPKPHDPFSEYRGL